MSNVLVLHWFTSSSVVSVIWNLILFLIIIVVFFIPLCTLSVLWQTLGFLFCTIFLFQMYSLVAYLGKQTPYFCREEHELLEAVQERLVVHPLTAPILGNDHNEFRSRESSLRKVFFIQFLLSLDVFFCVNECTNLRALRLRFVLGSNKENDFPMFSHSKKIQKRN